jgi:hypothetical protein
VIDWDSVLALECEVDTRVTSLGDHGLRRVEFVDFSEAFAAYSGFVVTMISTEYISKSINDVIVSILISQNVIIITIIYGEIKVICTIPVNVVIILFSFLIVI